VLYDVANQVVVDMKLTDHYRFANKGPQPFKIYYGSASFIDQMLLPERMQLGKSFPNPFTGVTTIPFGISGHQSSYFTIQVYDVSGRQVISLYAGTGKPGFNAIQWDGRNAQGVKMPAGIYLCKMAVMTGKDTREFTRKLVLLD
jgi:FlgD Ig-like domain